MTTRAKEIEPADAGERERAVATFDRNLVVTAGAGTGKTTLLVDRLAHLLARSPDPLRVTEIIALTFTNKAANEMKLRLRERLQAYLGVRLDREPAGDAAQKNYAELLSLLARYQLSKSELDERVQEALRNLERSEIGTIHSFAATLLRLHPLEAGVDPQFREDDGKQFELSFDEQWGLWLDQELSLQGPRADEWRRILKSLPLDQIKSLAESLCSETVELRRATPALKEQTIPAPLQSWLAGLESRAASLAERHPEDRLNEKLVRAAQSVIQAYRQGGGIPENDTADSKSLLLSGRAISRSVKGWSEEDADEAMELVRAARGLCQVDPGLTALLWDLLVPFAEKFRDFFLREGWISFDGLLIRARNLVRDHLRVREELKRRFRAILIDEFQDTDPIQYEILLYLAEQDGQHAKDWRGVKLTPGKVFVVGDPKQSIYAFRRADIEAYLEVVEKIIKAQDGIECRLTTNFRSDAAILDVVNGVFENLIQAKEGMQPPYIAIHPAPHRNSDGGVPRTDAGWPKVMVRKIAAGDENVSAEKARRLEAEGLAAWLKAEILERAVMINSAGAEVRAQPKDVAILFRKLTDIQDYLEPLRRRGIRYVVEGERHFYAVKEIIDTVNLFRAVENPYDRLALAGVLRSPLGGMTDQTIYELHRENLLDYREVKRLREKPFPTTLAELYAALNELHQETRTMSVGAAVSHIFASLPLRTLAACYFHGEQAVANLEKLRQQAEFLGAEGLITLKEAIHQLRRRVLEVKEEGESVLAEENLDAVRIMSIHKAKGLEFPIVVLAGCQSGTDARQGASAEALFDWSTGLTGLRVGQTWDLAGLYIAEKTRLRTEEEQKRVLYVAMTRAQERLVISCAPTTWRTTGSFLSMLDQPLSENIASAEESKKVFVGNGSLEIRLLSESLVAPGRSKSKPKGRRKKPHWQPYVDAWRQRRETYASITETPLFVTPTLFKRQEEELAETTQLAWGPLSRRAASLIVGDIAHRVLQNWDFTGDGRDYDDQLQSHLDHWLPEESRQDRAVIQSELKEIFHHFFGSATYAELKKTRILGREVPLLMPWDGQIMEGVIDLIYERDGLLYLADYKTDRITEEELTQTAERYHQQAQIYSLAARQSLNRDVAAFKLIFLRLGEAVEITPEKK